MRLPERSALCQNLFFSSSPFCLAAIWVSLWWAVCKSTDSIKTKRKAISVKRKTIKKQFWFSRDEARTFRRNPRKFVFSKRLRFVFLPVAMSRRRNRTTASMVWFGSFSISATTCIKSTSRQKSSASSMLRSWATSLTACVSFGQIWNDSFSVSVRVTWNGSKQAMAGDSTP